MSSENFLLGPYVQIKMSSEIFSLGPYVQMKTFQLTNSEDFVPTILKDVVTIILKGNLLLLCKSKCQVNIFHLVICADQR